MFARLGDTVCSMFARDQAIPLTGVLQDDLERTTAMLTGPHDPCTPRERTALGTAKPPILSLRFTKVEFLTTLLTGESYLACRRLGESVLWRE